MNKRVFRNHFFDYLSSCLLLSIILVFGYLNLHRELILFIPIYLVFVSIISRETLYITYVLIFLSNGIISKDIYLFNILGIQQISCIITIFVIISSTGFKAFKGSNHKAELHILFFIIIYVLLTSFKNAYFNIFETDYSSAILRLVNLLIITLPVYLIIKLKRDNPTFFYRVVTTSIIFFSVSAFMSNKFIDLGFYSNQEYALVALEWQRYFGLLGYGDSNSLALILVLGIAIVLTRIKTYGFSILNISTIFIALVGLGYSGSRSGIVALFIVLVIFVFDSRKSQSLNRAALVIIVILVSSQVLLETNVERFSNTGTEQMYTEGSTSNRVGKWIFYLNYFKNDPKAIIRGGDRELEIGWDRSFQVAHNFFIQIIYNAGIIIFFYFLYTFLKVIKESKCYIDNLWIIIIPLLLGISFISDYGAILFFIFCYLSLRK